MPTGAAKPGRRPRRPQQAEGIPPAAVALAVLVMAGFIVWLCAQMAITPLNRTYLLTIAGGIALGVLGLALGAVRSPRRRRRRRPEPTRRAATTSPEPSRPARRPGGMSPRPG